MLVCHDAIAAGGAGWKEEGADQIGSGGVRNERSMCEGSCEKRSGLLEGN